MGSGAAALYQNQYNQIEVVEAKRSRKSIVAIQNRAPDGTIDGKVRDVLKVNIISARGLRKADWFGLSDPYCTLQLRGEPGIRGKTDVKKKTLEPTWNYKAEVARYDGQSLVLKIYDWDRVGSHDYLGEATVPANAFMPDGCPATDFPLRGAGGGANDAHIRLKVEVERAGQEEKTIAPRTIIVGIKKSKGLRKADMFGLSDPYATVEFEGVTGTQAKTHVCYKTLCPEWNWEAEVTDYIDEAIIFSVHDWDRVGGHDFLGSVTLTPDKFLPRGCDWVELELENHGKSKKDSPPTIMVKVKTNLPTNLFEILDGKLVSSHALTYTPSTDVLLRPTGAFLKGGSGRPVHEEIPDMYPHENFELTAYGNCVGLALDAVVYLEGFSTKPVLDGHQGVCYLCDKKRAVWLVRFEGGMRMRVVPMNQVPMEYSPGVVADPPWKGFALFGAVCADICIDNRFCLTVMPIGRPVERMQKPVDEDEEAKKDERPSIVEPVQEIEDMLDNAMGLRRIKDVAAAERREAPRVSGGHMLVRRPCVDGLHRSTYLKDCRR